LSFDHLVGARQHGGRNFEAERLRCLEIDHQLILGRRLHRKVGRLLALEDAIDVAGRLTVLVDVIRPIGGQAAGGEAAGQVTVTSTFPTLRLSFPAPFQAINKSPGSNWSVVLLDKAGAKSLVS
jgi:hypothetical protein